MNLIDKCLLKFFGYIDDIAAVIDSLFFSKYKKKVFTIKGKKYVLKKQKKKVCKNCHCKCHCKDDLHLHFYDQELCTCGKCKCTKK